MSAGRRRAAKVSRPVLPAVGLFACALLAAAAWVFLVRAAIDFGQNARGGQGVAWVFLGIATLGATVCLLLVLALVTRGLRMLGVLRDRPAGRAGVRRAASRRTPSGPASSVSPRELEHP